jgi:hypothetical protein
MMTSDPAGTTTSWAAWRAARDQVLATMTDCCPRPPGASAFLQILTAYSSARSSILQSPRCAPGGASTPPELRRLENEIRAFVERLLGEVADADVRALVWVTVSEAERSARAALAMRPLVISNVTSFDALPPLFASAVGYLHGVLAWSGLKISATRATRGRPSRLEIVAATRVEAGRRRRRPRISALGDKIPRSAARDSADRILAWLAEDVARMVAGELAIPAVAAVPCSAGACCRGRRAAIEAALVQVHQGFASQLLSLADRSVPAVTLRGRRGRRAALCDARKRDEKAVRDEMRMRKGFRDPLSASGRRVSEKLYRARLEEKQHREDDEHQHHEDAKGPARNTSRRR